MPEILIWTVLFEEDSKEATEMDKSGVILITIDLPGVKSFSGGGINNCI